jgi:alkanesulfonate monooxygenase SsuD/methylene tetrahydromethanopterin reductase-like flavin-dependent oxidoreductase (luciferase family)
MKFGVWIPSYCYPGLDYARVRQEVHDFSRKANDLRLDLFVIDHLLHAPGLYGMPWLEPLTVLTYASAVAPDVRVGTGILVLPLRHPVVLAKQVATLDFVTGGRFIFGVGPGWDPREFEAVGHQVSERGGRTDEILTAVRRLLTEENVTFEGRYYQFRELTIEPRPPKLPEIWVSGGSRLPDPQYTADPPDLAPSVLRRILSSNAWLARNSGTNEWLKRDWAQIREALRAAGRPDSDVRFHHVNFTYVVDTDDREKALAIQRPFFEQVMGSHRSFEHLETCYLMGTPADIVGKLRDLQDAGLQYTVIGPTSDDLEQLELIAERIVPELS